MRNDGTPRRSVSGGLATYKLTLLDELGSVVLGDNRLEDLVSDRREDTLVVVEAEVLVDLGKVLDVRSGEDAEGDRNHLEVCENMSVR